MRLEHLQRGVRDLVGLGDRRCRPGLESHQLPFHACACLQQAIAASAFDRFGEDGLGVREAPGLQQRGAEARQQRGARRIVVRHQPGRSLQQARSRGRVSAQERRAGRRVEPFDRRRGEGALALADGAELGEQAVGLARGGARSSRPGRPAAARASGPPARAAPLGAAWAAPGRRPRESARARTGTRPGPAGRTDRSGSAACAPARPGASRPSPDRPHRAARPARRRRSCGPGRTRSSSTARSPGSSRSMRAASTAWMRRRERGAAGLRSHCHELFQEERVALGRVHDPRGHGGPPSRRSPRVRRASASESAASTVTDRLGCGASQAGRTWANSGRAMQMSRIGCPLENATRYSSRSSSVGSAQWTSSTTTTSGRSRGGPLEQPAHRPEGLLRLRGAFGQADRAQDQPGHGARRRRAGPPRARADRRRSAARRSRPAGGRPTPSP